MDPATAQAVISIVAAVGGLKPIVVAILAAIMTPALCALAGVVLMARFMSTARMQTMAHMSSVLEEERAARKEATIACHEAHERIFSQVTQHIDAASERIRESVGVMGGVKETLRDCNESHRALARVQGTAR